MTGTRSSRSCRRVPRRASNPWIDPGIAAPSPSTARPDRSRSRRWTGAPVLSRSRCGSRIRIMLLSIVERVKRMFDVAADPAVIAEQLSVDPLLRRACSAHAGIRVPGRVGSVRARGSRHPRTADLRPCRHHHRRARGGDDGDRRRRRVDGLDRLFPPPAQLQDARIEEAGVIASTSRRHPRPRARGVQTARSHSMALRSSMRSVPSRASASGRRNTSRCAR